MSSERRRAWAYLSRVVEGPSASLQRLLGAGRDVEEIAGGIRRREPWLGELLGATESRHSLDTADLDLATAAGIGARLITAEDEEWPHEELDQAFGFASSGHSEHLRSYQSDAVPPHVLWVRGGNLRAASARAVTIVGTRAVSRYGAEVTSMLTEDLVAHQWAVVSGGALGVDTIAHTGALRAGGCTVAVAACGLDRSYPARNGRLFEQVVESGSGVLVSEYPPGVPPQRHRFLTRNRLVAALTGGTVVVEAAWRSGALNTLSWASGLGKVAMAVPGPITTAGSRGCHERIRNGEAELIAGGADVRALLEALGEVDAQGQLEMEFAASPVQSLSRNELRVFDALSTRPREAGEVAAESGLSLPLVIHLLVELDSRRLIRRVGTKWERIFNPGMVAEE
ncbi:DNA-processing protein DprA [Corynebacterium pacaense]|uniref:DNA-processing protein DprA n=1 Tax=Corynebacterium pacaense TaxID=1816684 RepID=UPI0009BA58E9|nr:DNA-processing protein DprA [Corynebacterium pacaense]